MLPGVERAFQMEIIRDLNFIVMIAGNFRQRIVMRLFQLMEQKCLDSVIRYLFR